MLKNFSPCMQTYTLLQTFHFRRNFSLLEPFLGLNRGEETESLSENREKFCFIYFLLLALYHLRATWVENKPRMLIE